MCILFLFQCARKHCSIMKTSMVHISSCSEFTSCSNAICLLFSPLLLHWKTCCGPCSVCGPINMKYNKKKLLSKISPKVIVDETKHKKVVFQGQGKTNDRRPGIDRATPYHLRKYMMEDQSAVSAARNGYGLQVVSGNKVEGIALPSAGNTWDQLPGIDFALGRLLGKPLKPDSVNNPGFIRSHEYNSSCPSYSECNSDLDQNCIQDLLNAISLYNHKI